MQMKGGVSVNDDEGLEHEADVMGAQAHASQLQRPQQTTPWTSSLLQGTPHAYETIQRVKEKKVGTVKVKYAESAAEAPRTLQKEQQRFWNWDTDLQQGRRNSS
jgi:hypothetical protein